MEGEPSKHQTRIQTRSSLRQKTKAEDQVKREGRPHSLQTAPTAKSTEEMKDAGVKIQKKAAKLRSERDRQTQLAEAVKSVESVCKKVASIALRKTKRPGKPRLDDSVFERRVREQNVRLQQQMDSMTDKKSKEWHKLRKRQIAQ